MVLDWLGSVWDRYLVVACIVFVCVVRVVVVVVVCLCGVFCFLLMDSDGGIGRIAQSVERSANNAVVLGSSPSMTNLLIPEA